MCVIRAEIIYKRMAYSDGNTERLLTAAANPNDCMQDNTDGFKLPVVWIRDLRWSSLLKSLNRWLRLSDHLVIPEEVILLHYITYSNNNHLSNSCVPFTHSALSTRRHSSTKYLLWPTLSTSFIDLVLHTPPSVLSRPCRRPVEVAGMQREEAHIKVKSVLSFVFQVVIIMQDNQAMHSAIMMSLHKV